MEVRCLACAATYEWHPSYPMCPGRYASPHDDDFMALVADKLKAMGAIEKTSREDHAAAIRAALAERREREKAVPPT
jgi:hypothetical protein